MTTAEQIPGWTHIYSGKVRDLYERADRPGQVLMVASDRVSAFDHVLEPAIPGKGAFLTALTLWWCDQLDVPNHLAAEQDMLDDLKGRGTVVRKLDMYPIECVVRGYLSGSAWVEYQQTQSVCGIALPAGLADGDRLPEPIYTPAFKAPLGEHDENISFERSAEIVGQDVAEALRAASLRIFVTASAIAEQRGLILADTKFEFGNDPETGVLTLGDEVLTSDSSRYWSKDDYDAGRRGVSFDKQGVRDWLAANWDRTGTPPALPAEIVEQTADRYRDLAMRLVR